MTLKSIITLVVVVLVVGVVGYYWTNNQNQANNTSSNIESKTTNTEETIKTETTKVPEGAYTYELTSGTVRYLANKVFLNKPAEVVTGTNTNLVGEGYYSAESDMGFLSVTFNFSDFSTGNQMRDSDLFQNYIQDKNIKVEGDFTDLAITEGNEQTVSIPLNVTINGVTKSINFDVTLTLTADNLMAKGSSKVMMSEFNVNPPTLANVYNVEDEIGLEFDITAE